MARNPNEAIYKYLREQNRPYSALDILTNMHKEFGKTQVLKSLDHLVQEGTIREKANGKQKVYAVVQEDAKSEDIKKNIEQTELQNAELKMQVDKLQEKIVSTERKIQQLNSIPVTKEAGLHLVNVNRGLDVLKSKLEVLRSSDVKITPQEKALLTAERVRFVKEYQKRKRVCMDVVNSILEGYPKDKKALLEEVGIEMD